MGHEAAMNIARAIAVKCSDVVISNADEYNHVYEQEPLNTKENLQKLNAAYGFATAVAGRYSPNHETKNEYWIELGHAGLKRKNISLLRGLFIHTLAESIQVQLDNEKNTRKRPQEGGTKIRYGKCFVCAAIAAYKLIKDSTFRGYNLSVEICKTSGVHHYFTVIGRTPLAAGLPDRGTINTVAGWGANSFIVDIWQGNLNQPNPLWGRESDDKFGSPAITQPEGWAYIDDAKGNHLQVVAQMKPPFTAELQLINQLKNPEG